MVLVHIVVLLAAPLTLLLLRRVVTAGQRQRPASPASPVSEAAVRYYRSTQGRDEARALRRLDRALRARGPGPAPGQVAIEQLAVDLRRLAHQRHTGLNRESLVWQAAVLRAYDQRLTMACQCLDIVEHLEPLDGIDRELERLRVESELQAAGIAF